MANKIQWNPIKKSPGDPRLPGRGGCCRASDICYANAWFLRGGHGNMLGVGGDIME